MVSPIQQTWVWADPGGWWWTGKPGVLQSVGSQRVGHNWATELNRTNGLPQWLRGKESACQYNIHKRCGFDSWVGKNPWSRKWQSSPVFLPQKFHGQRSLSSVQSLSRVQLFATPWTAACQASVTITNSQSLLKFMSIVSVMSYDPAIPLISILLKKTKAMFFSKY